MNDEAPEWECADCGGTDCQLCQAEWREQQEEIAAADKLSRIKVVGTKPYQVIVFIGGDLELAKTACQKFCDEKGECVTVEPTDYIYTGGSTPGVRVGFINYARFPRSRRVIFDQALELARWLLVALDQESCTVIAPDRNRWLTTREQSK